MASIDIIKLQEMQKYGVGRRRNSGGVVCLQMWLKCSIYRLKTGDPRSCVHLPSQLRGVHAQIHQPGGLAAARSTLRSCEGYEAATFWSVDLVTLPTSSLFKYAASMLASFTLLSESALGY